MGEPLTKPPEPAQEPTVPTPEAALEGLLGGQDVKSFLAGPPPEPEKEPEKPPEPTADLSKEMGLLTKQIEAANTRVQEAEQAAAERSKEHSRNWQQEHLQRREAEAYSQGVRQARAAEQQIAQAAQAAQFPDLDFDFEKAVEDPEAATQQYRANLKQASEWAVRQALGSVYPYFASHQQMVAMAEPTQTFMMEVALDREGTKLKEQGFTDFDDFREDIKKGFLARGPEGVAMVLQTPDVIRGAYGAMRLGRGLTFQTPEQSTPPIQASTAPSAKTGHETSDDKKIPERLLAMWNSMKDDFGDIPPPTAENLRKHNISGDY